MKFFLKAQSSPKTSNTAEFFCEITDSPGTGYSYVGNGPPDYIKINSLILDVKIPSYIFLKYFISFLLEQLNRLKLAENKIPGGMGFEALIKDNMFTSKKEYAEGSVIGKNLPANVGSLINFYTPILDGIKLAQVSHFIAEDAKKFNDKMIESALRVGR
ncbi:MAG: hypothetical protein QM652_14155 [Legionella sp.]|uniref:hypothetical protein n=1 Tax=Legionella sp. TaxID=459 RepID=UPI0039E5B581